MADRPKRDSALSALRAGAIITSESGSGVGETEKKTPKSEGLEGGGNQGGNSAASAGTANAPKSPVAAFAARTRENYQGVEGTKPVYGTHPKSGEQVEIDYSQDGASPDAPFGLLPDGSPRVRRASKRARNSSAGGQSAIKSEPSVSILADAILFVHTFAAGVTSHPHWNMSQDEARNYADALTDLQAAYGVDLSPKQAAWAKAATVIGIPTALRVVASMTYKPPMKRVENPKPDSQPREQSKQAPSPPVQTGGKGPQTPSQLFEASGGNFLDGLTTGAE